MLWSCVSNDDNDDDDYDGGHGDGGHDENKETTRLSNDDDADELMMILAISIEFRAIHTFTSQNLERPHHGIWEYAVSIFRCCRALTLALAGHLLHRHHHHHNSNDDSNGRQHQQRHPHLLPNKPRKWARISEYKTTKYSLASDQGWWEHWMFSTDNDMNFKRMQKIGSGFFRALLFRGLNLWNQKPLRALPMPCAGGLCVCVSVQSSD